MANSPGSALQSALRRQLVTAVRRIRDELDAAGSLRDLPKAGAEWGDTALEGRLLAPLGQANVANPLAAAVLRGLLQLGISDPGSGVVAGLHGWAPEDPTGPRGIAYALRVASGAGGLAFAVHITGGDAGPRLGLTVSGSQGPQPASAVLDGGWTVTVTGGAEAALEASMGLDGSVDLGQNAVGDSLRFDVMRPNRGARLGPPGGPGVALGAIAWGGELRVAPGRTLQRSGWVRNTGGAVELVPGGLAGLVPGLGPLPLAVDLRLDPEAGLSLSGSTALEARLPVALSAPGVELDALDLALRLETPPTDAGVGVTVDVRTAARVSLPGVPIVMRFDGLGLQLPFAFGDVPRLGFDPQQLRGLKPGGAGVDIDLPVIRGAGFVAERPSGEYAGALSVSMPPLSANAFGVLQLRPLSFLVLLGATFPPPGIQVGFGFAVSGIGGVVGVNRRVDRNALLRAVADGTAANLLFPTDPAAAAGAVQTALPAMFPPSRGSVVTGPMFQVSWGGRLVTGSVAVLIEVSAQSRLTILGKLVVAIPDPEAALILIQVTFAGQFDPGEPSVLIVASMTGSHIVGVPLTGDVCLLTRGGSDPTFVLSAGGFHPAFPLPRGVPVLRRIGTDLSTLPRLELRCEAYLAVTTNTVQFGARIELAARVAECGLRGHLSLDVLLQFEPLHFIVDVSIGIALTLFGEELVGVALDLRLEGPAKWHAKGRGSIDLFLFTVHFDFDKEWGSAPALAQPAPDVGAELARALESPDAWVVHRPAAGPVGVALTPAADRALGRGELIDPYGSITVRQRRVPLGLTIDRFDRIPLGTPQLWDLVDGRLGDRPAPSGREVRDLFAAGQYLTLSDDQELSRPAFEQFRAGFDLAGGEVARAPLEPFTIGFETQVFADEIGEPERPDFNLLLSSALMEVAAASPDHPMWWPVPEETVTVLPATPVMAASAWALTAVSVQASGGTAAELHEALAREDRPDLMVVEAWEMAG